MVDRRNGWLDELVIGYCAIAMVPLTAMVSSSPDEDDAGCRGSLGERFFGETQVAVDWDAGTLSFDRRACGRTMRAR